MNRRSLLLATMGLVTGGSAASAQKSTPITLTQPELADEVPYLPDAVEALRIMELDFSISGSWSMIVWSFAWETEDSADAAFRKVRTFYRNSIEVDVLENEVDVDRVSVGKLGDDRAAYIADGGEFDSQLIVAVRVGAVIAVSRFSISERFSVDDAAEFIDGYLPSTASSATDLLPTVDDYPVGFTSSGVAPIDMLPYVKVEDN